MIFQDGKVRWMLNVIAEEPDFEFQTRRPRRYGEDLQWVDDTTKCVIHPSGCIKYQVGRDCAVQPGRTKPGIWQLPDGVFRPDGARFLLNPMEGAASGVRWGPAMRESLRQGGYRELRQLITDIREEPLQDISDEDCLAEGICKYPGGSWGPAWRTSGGCSLPKWTYWKMWDEIYKGKRLLGSEQNPIVFAYTFRLVMR